MHYQRNIPFALSSEIPVDKIFNDSIDRENGVIWMMRTFSVELAHDNCSLLSQMEDLGGKWRLCLRQATQVCCLSVEAERYLPDLYARFANPPGKLNP